MITRWPSSPRPRAVCFDVGSTLIDPWPSVGHAYARVAAAHGQPGLDPVLLTRRFLAAWQERTADFDYTRASWARMVASTLAGLSPLAGDDRFFSDLYDFFATAEPWRVYPEVTAVLERLGGAGCALAVISNWDERLRPLLEALSLADYFDVIVVSGEMGIPKPNVAIFEHALARLGVRPEEALHVGDSMHEDFLGARAAGLAALRLDRARAATDGDTIASLDEVLDRVGLGLAAAPPWSASRPA